MHTISLFIGNNKRNVNYNSRVLMFKRVRGEVLFNNIFTIRNDTFGFTEESSIIDHFVENC